MSQHIIISGSNGNLGRATVKTFLEAGYQVTGLVDSRKPAPVSENPHLAYRPLNLLDAKQTQTQIAEACSQYAGLHAAVMAAGGFAMGNIFETDSKAIHDMYSLNFETAYHVARPVFDRLAKQGKGGHLIFIGAKPVFEPAAAKGLVSYVLSKTLVFKLAELLNDEGKQHGIRSTVIVPSIIDTPTNRSAMPDADFSAWVRPETIAYWIKEICSEKGSALRETVLKLYGNV